MTRGSDVLLYVLSDRSSMSWASFRSVFDYLDSQRLAPFREPFTQLRYRRRQTARALDALAHAELHFGEDTAICVAPTALARLPQNGLPQAVLTGARSPDAIARLKEVTRGLGCRVGINVQPQSGALPLTPSRVVLQAESAELLNAVARAIAVPFESNPPAWVIPQVVPSLDAYLGSLDWSHRRELNWERSDFWPAELRFGAVNQSSSEWRLSRYRELSRGATEFILWHDGLGATVAPEWGRYAVLKHSVRTVLHYDEQHFTLAVPYAAPLPRLLTRALTLCSGFAPRFIPASQPSCQSQAQWGFEIFQAVPPQIAQVVAARLDQRIVRGSIASMSPKGAQ